MRLLLEALFYGTVSFAILLFILCLVSANDED